MHGETDESLKQTNEKERVLQRDITSASQPLRRADAVWGGLELQLAIVHSFAGDDTRTSWDRFVMTMTYTNPYAGEMLPLL